MASLPALEWLEAARISCTRDSYRRAWCRKQKAGRDNDEAGIRACIRIEPKPRTARDVGRIKLRAEPEYRTVREGAVKSSFPGESSHAYSGQLSARVTVSPLCPGRSSPPVWPFQRPSALQSSGQGQSGRPSTLEAFTDSGRASLGLALGRTLGSFVEAGVRLGRTGQVLRPTQPKLSSG